MHLSSLTLLMFVTFCTGAQDTQLTHLPGKRQLIQLGNLIMCATGRFPFYYTNYGCFCGPGGNMKYLALDDTDQCCRDHDACYDFLSEHCPGYVFGLFPFPYFAFYRYSRQSCRSLLWTRWEQVSPGVFQAPERSKNVRIRCAKKQSGDKRSALCRKTLCQCDSNLALCLSRSNYNTFHHSINVKTTCVVAEPGHNTRLYGND